MLDILSLVKPSSDAMDIEVRAGIMAITDLSGAVIFDPPFCSGVPFVVASVQNTTNNAYAWVRLSNITMDDFSFEIANFIVTITEQSPGIFTEKITFADVANISGLTLNWIAICYTGGS